MNNDIINVWKDSLYYEKAEKDLNTFWNNNSIFLKFFKQLNLKNVVELACGHGRHSEYALKNFDIKNITLVDIVDSNIEFCKNRLSTFNNVSYIINSGSNIKQIPDNSITSIFCYDAMVHFEYDDIGNYLKDFYRILIPSGRVLLHHSNSEECSGKDYKNNYHWRNYMTKSLFNHMVYKANLKIINQSVIDWEIKNLDCLTLLEK